MLIAGRFPEGVNQSTPTMQSALRLRKLGVE
jgi:hypothetical protein